MIATSLNEKRKASSALDVETDAKLQIFLERAIEKENHAAGIGFVVGGKMLDLKALKTIFKTNL